MHHRNCQSTDYVDGLMTGVFAWISLTALSWTYFISMFPVRATANWYVLLDQMPHGYGAMRQFMVDTFNLARANGEKVYSYTQINPSIT